MPLITSVTEIHKKKKIIPTFEDGIIPRTLMTKNLPETYISGLSTFSFDLLEIPFNFKFNLTNLGICIVTRTNKYIIPPEPEIYIRIFDDVYNLTLASSYNSFEQIELEILGKTTIKFEIVNENLKTLPIVAFASYYLEAV